MVDTYAKLINFHSKNKISVKGCPPSLHFVSDGGD